MNDAFWDAKMPNHVLKEKFCCHWCTQMLLAHFAWDKFGEFGQTVYTREHTVARLACGELRDKIH